MGSRIPTIIEDAAKTGRIIGVNRARLGEHPFFLLPNKVAATNSITVSANRSSVPSMMAVSEEGPMLIHALGHQKTGAMTCMLQIMDGQTPTSLMNNAINVGCIFGNNGQPFYFPEALYLDQGRALAARFTDISGSTNAIRPVAFGAKYTKVIYDPTLKLTRKRMQQRQFVACPYFYTIEPTNDDGVPAGASRVSANGTNNEVVNISQTHDFELFKMTFIATSSSFNINVVEAESGESIIDSPGDTNYAVSANIIMGNANFPFVFHEPRLFRGGSKLLVTLTDYSGSQNDIFICFSGRTILKRKWGPAA